MSTTASASLNKSRSYNFSNDDNHSLNLKLVSTEPQDHPFASVFDPWFKKSEMDWTYSRNANAMMQATTAAIHGAIKVFQETNRFMGERLIKDMKTASAFTECRTGEDYFKVQSSFFDEAVRDYGEEAAKIMHFATDVTQAAYKPIEDRTKEALHSIAAIPEDNGHFV